MVKEKMNIPGFEEFVKMVWPLGYPDQRHIGAICDHLELVISIPPGCMKPRRSK